MSSRASQVFFKVAVFANVTFFRGIFREKQILYILFLGYSQKKNFSKYSVPYRFFFYIESRGTLRFKTLISINKLYSLFKNEGKWDTKFITVD